jgi:hypothetical protein
MAFQQPDYITHQLQQNAQQKTLRTLASDFGTLLRTIRQRNHLSMVAVVASLATYFEDAGVPVPSQDMYERMERDNRAPQYRELVPLYQALVAGCGFSFSAAERHAYVELAHVKIESKTRYKEAKRPDAEWRMLERQLAQFDHAPLEENEEEEQEKRQEEHRRVLSQLEQDTSHILGREEDCSGLLSLLQLSSPRKKVIAISAMSGIGKSSLLKLLQKRLLESESAQAIDTIACTFQESNKEVAQTVQECFDELLATIYTALVPKQKEISSVPPVKKRIQQTLQAIASHSRALVIFLDDAQRLIGPSGEWCEEWKQFLQEFTTNSHQATLYIASREWPIWQERESASFIVHKELLPISAETGIVIWRNLGFTQEDEELLKRATEVCGNNPRMMELVAQKMNTADFSFDWDDDGTTQKGLAHFVEHPRLTGIAPLLEDIIGNTLSEPAKHLLKLLALAPVALPPPVVLYVSANAKQCIHELAKASLLSKHPDRLRLLPMVAESAIEHLLQEERNTLQELLMQAYPYWLRAGKFQSEQEQAQVVTELLLLYFRQYRLMEATELLISGGWLCYHFGYGPRLARVCQEILTNYDWKQSPQQELAANLLYDRLASFRGEKVTTAERAKRYQILYKQAQENSIPLAPTTIAHLLQFIVFHLADTTSFQEAETLIKAHLDQVEALKDRDPFMYASYLYCKAYLYAKWSEHELPEDNANPFSAALSIPDQARTHLEDAIRLFAECATLLKESERGASPLQRSRATYKRARRLHNYAYYARLAGIDLPGAKQALETCIKLEKQGYTTPGSLATAHAEYAQVLAAVGSYQTALEASDQALGEIAKDATSGYGKAEREKAVLLVERADIHLIIGNLDEARQLYCQAIPHLEQEIRREKYLRKAKTGLKTIATIENALERTNTQPLSGQLDHQWYSLYSQIADFDLLAWLDPAGPLSSEEQALWATYAEHGKVDELRQLMNSSLSQELNQAVAEQRSPQLLYPAIPIIAVREKIKACQDLKNRIEREEPNKIVKQLYLEALLEQTCLLQMVEATYQGDRDTIASYGRLLFSMPTAREMEIATGELLKTIERGMQQEETKGLSQQIKKRLQALSLMTSHHASRMSKTEENDNRPALLERIMSEQATIKVSQVAQFLEECFQEYGFGGWSVSVKANVTAAFVEVNTKQLVLPERDVTAARVLHLLAHEGEGHVYRHDNGAKSKFSLLGHGLAGYSPIEEALAVRYTAEAEHKRASLPWIGTLATGLASGRTSIPGHEIEPLSYHELYCFMRDYHLLNQLLQGLTMQTAQEKAHRLAQRRCQRTYLGGVCWPQDNSYLHGTLELESFLQNHEDDDILERLLVGCINIEHLTNCHQLGISKPVIPHKQLAKQEVVLKAILSLADRSFTNNK